MAKLQVFDSPINQDDDDLFGMANYAQKLASFIETVTPPFTIGVYGEWGDGKTSFVRLLRQSLEASISEDKIKFIAFSAWPHTTSDALWRALIIKIARDLYAISESETGTPPPAAPKAPRPDGLWPALASFLFSDAVVLRPEPSPQDDLAKYRDLISRLDRTAYGSISKNKEQQVQVNNDVALLSIVNAAIAALGTVSPLVAGLRSLLGIEPKVNLSELLHTEKNVATRDLIESIQEFKQVFRQLFLDKAEGKRVFVFVDDLDRCLPDVALDILEAIKMFLDEVGCIFIVAADENLIGQGLRLRYSDLFRNNDDQHVHSFFAQKGQEYFEKIIQFAVRVPARTTDQAHRFISAQFPQWTPATDIIQTALGSNPRRLKQYCNQLTYKYLVSQIQVSSAAPGPSSLPVLDDRKRQLLDKIITLQSWSEHSLRKMRGFLAQPDTFPAVMTSIEKLLEDSQEDKPRPQAEAGLGDDSQYEFYTEAVKSAPLFNLLKGSPRFSAEPPDHTATCVEFADIKPHSGRTMLMTRDTAFMRILAAVEIQEPVDPAKLLVLDLTKLIYFDHERPDIFEKLRELADGTDWMSQLAALEGHFDPASISNGSGDEPLNQTADSLRQLLEVEDPSSPSSVIKLFLDAPRFSAMLREEVHLYEGVREQLPQAETLLAKELFASATAIDKYRRIAAATLSLLPPVERQKVESYLALRREAAQYFLELRKSAKVDALIYKWPEIARQYQVNGPAFLKTLEAQVLEPETVAKGTAGSWQRYLEDEQLVRFLRLRPLFRDIYPHEFSKYIAAAQVVAKPEAQKISASVPPVMAAAVYDQLEVVYDDFFVRIASIEGATDRYQVSLQREAGAPVSEEIDIPISAADRFEAMPLEAFSARGGIPVTRDAHFRANDLMAYLRQHGTQLYDMIFTSAAQRNFFEEALKTSRHLRIILEFNDQRLMQLPWESLYVPALRTFPGLVTKYSLVRHFPQAISLTPRTLSPPLRILVVATNPHDAVLLDIKQEIEILNRTLAPAIQEGHVQLKIVEQGTLPAIQHDMRVFRPHLFHFIGHGTYQVDAQEGALIFENEDGTMRAVGASDLKTLLVDSNIILAVLNACDTGATGQQNVNTGIAGTLVNDGIPAAVATMSAVLDSQALMFTREFYQAFTDGYTLEASIIEARKAISIEKWNWAAYALFSNTTKLDSFKLVRNQARKEGLT